MPDARKTADTRRDPPHYIYVQRPRCPVCASPRLRAYRTIRNGDDSLTRYSRCLECGMRLITVGTVYRQQIDKKFHAVDLDCHRLSDLLHVERRHLTPQEEDAFVVLRRDAL